MLRSTSITRSGCSGWSQVADRAIERTRFSPNRPTGTPSMPFPFCPSRLPYSRVPYPTIPADSAAGQCIPEDAHSRRRIEPVFDQEKRLFPDEADARRIGLELALVQVQRRTFVSPETVNEETRRGLQRLVKAHDLRPV